MNSMTGYGLGEFAQDSIHFKVEIKSVNNRYNEIFIKLPNNLLAFEEKIRKIIKERVFRGKINVNIYLTLLEEGSLTINPNIALAQDYYNSLNEIKNSLGLAEPIELSQIYSFPNVLSIESKELNNEELWNPCNEALSIALDNFLQMRSREGEDLKEDFYVKLKSLCELTLQIETMAPVVIEENVQKLKERIRTYTEEENLDLQRLTTEVAIMCDKLSIDEEIIRIKSHLDHFNDILNIQDAIGRKLDFVLQELNREINTIGSKSNSIEILNTVVEVKSEIEKLREQVQNIE